MSKILFRFMFRSHVGVFQPLKLIARCAHLKIEPIKETLKKIFVGSYHAHSSFDAGKEEKCKKEEKKKY